MQGGLRVRQIRGIPAPFPLVFGDGPPGRSLMAINTALIRIARGLFSCQMLFVVEPRRSLECLLREAHHEAAVRGEAEVRRAPAP